MGEVRTHLRQRFCQNSTDKLVDNNHSADPQEGQGSKKVEQIEGDEAHLEWRLLEVV